MNTPWNQMTKHEVAARGLEEITGRFRSEGFTVAEDRDRGRTRLHVKRATGPSYEVRVATMRPPGGNYAFFTKASFRPSEHLLAALVLLEDGHDPLAFLIPSAAWSKPTPLLCDRDYEGKASAPEWGIQVTGKSRPFLDEFSFGRQVRLLWPADGRT